MKETIVLPEEATSPADAFVRYTAENRAELNVLKEQPMKDFLDNGINVVAWNLERFNLSVALDTIIEARVFFKKIGITITNLIEH